MTFKEFRSAPRPQDQEQGARTRNAGSSVARTVPLVLIGGYPDDKEPLFVLPINVSEEELILNLRNIGREDDEDIRRAMLRIFIKQLITTSHK